MNRRLLPIVLLLGVPWLASGCGYTTDRNAVFRTENSNKDPIHTVALNIFDSKEFRRGLELQLTEALAKRLESESPFKLAKKDRADTILTGEIKEVRQATLGRDFRTVTPRETSATIVVDFTWKDLRTGEVLLTCSNFLQTVDYIRPLKEDFYHASQKDMDLLAERIVEQMQPEW